MKILVRYILLQIPGWILLACLLWWAISNTWITFSTAALIMALWLLKDALLYPLCKSAFEDGPGIGPETLIGRETRAIVPLTPRGLVMLDGEYWSACIRDNKRVPAGCRIRVTAVEGLVLIVEPADR